MYIKTARGMYLNSDYVIGFYSEVSEPKDNSLHETLYVVNATLRDVENDVPIGVYSTERDAEDAMHHMCCELGNPNLRFCIMDRDPFEKIKFRN